MHLILMRHPERRRDVPEASAPLTPTALQRARETVTDIASKLKSFDLILRSNVTAARETAELFLPFLSEGGHIKEAAPLFPNSDPISLAKIEPYLKGKRNHIVLIGHHPGMTQLLADLVGKGKACRTLNRGEAVWVKVEDGKGVVRQTFGPAPSSELLRKKVELKMTVSTFLAGFNIPVLVEMVKDRKEGFTPLQLSATVLFTAAFCLFAMAVYMYDELLMPGDYWGPVEKALQPKEDSRSRFAHHYRLNGRTYAYMLRTWNWFFTPGVVCTALGFVCLILGKFPGENVLWAVIGCALIIFVMTPLAYWRWHPRLGIED
jgi:phosphohistidine phosphatase SixA